MIYIMSVIVILLGLSVGSFINCWAWRLHKDKSLQGRSMCPKCKHKLAWYDNIPVLSFLLLKTNCRYCHKPISWQYLLVEVSTAFLFILAFCYSPWSQELSFSGQALWSLLELFRNWLLIGFMVIIFIMDFNWYIIVDKVSLPACIIMLVLNLLLGLPWQNLLLAGIIGAGFFLLQFIVSGGKWIGGGDIRLGLLMGLALGWPMVLVALMLGYLLGAIFGIGLMIRDKKSLKSKIPFGTFLTIATIISLFWGDYLLSWYLSLYI